MWRPILFSIAVTVAADALGDGIEFVNGRYPQGEITELALTQEQVNFIELFRRCNRPNKETPYVLRLSPSQRAELNRKAGFAPSRFAVVEGFRGADGDELTINVANRIAKDRIEILHRTLKPDKVASEWEYQVMGWKRNPFLTISASEVKAGRCPQ